MVSLLLQQLRPWETNKNGGFSKGQTVQARKTRGTDSFHLGTISTVHPDYTFDVKFENGERGVHLAAEDLRVVSCGDRVSAYRSIFGVYCTGVITSINKKRNTYSVRFDEDGQEEHEIPFDKIRPLSTAEEKVLAARPPPLQGNIYACSNADALSKKFAPAQTQSSSTHSTGGIASTIMSAAKSCKDLLKEKIPHIRRNSESANELSKKTAVHKEEPTLETSTVRLKGGNFTIPQNRRHSLDLGKNTYGDSPPKVTLRGSVSESNKDTVVVYGGAAPGGHTQIFEASLASLSKPVVTPSTDVDMWSMHGASQETDGGASDGAGGNGVPEAEGEEVRAFSTLQGEAKVGSPFGGQQLRRLRGRRQELDEDDNIPQHPQLSLTYSDSGSSTTDIDRPPVASRAAVPLSRLGLGQYMQEATNEVNFSIDSDVVVVPASASASKCREASDSLPRRGGAYILQGPQSSRRYLSAEAKDISELSVGGSIERQNRVEEYSRNEVSRRVMPAALTTELRDRSEKKKADYEIDESRLTPKHVYKPYGYGADDAVSGMVPSPAGPPAAPALPLNMWMIATHKSESRLSGSSDEDESESASEFYADPTLLHESLSRSLSPVYSAMLDASPTRSSMLQPQLQLQQQDLLRGASPPPAMFTAHEYADPSALYGTSKMSAAHSITTTTTAVYPALDEAQDKMSLLAEGYSVMPDVQITSNSLQHLSLNREVVEQKPLYPTGYSAMGGVSPPSTPIAQQASTGQVVGRREVMHNTRMEKHTHETSAPFRSAPDAPNSSSRVRNTTVAVSHDGTKVNASTYMIDSQGVSDPVLLSVLARPEIVLGEMFEVAIKAYLKQERGAVIEKAFSKGEGERGLPGIIPLFRNMSVTVYLVVPDEVFEPICSTGTLEGSGTIGHFVWKGTEAECRFGLRARDENSLPVGWWSANSSISGSVSVPCTASVIQGDRVIQLAFRLELKRPGERDFNIRSEEPMNISVTEVDAPASISRENLKFGACLGRGNQGETFEGVLQIPSNGMSTSIDVAIKQCHKHECIDSIEHEATLLSRLGHHPNIVKFHGVCKDGDSVLLVTELEKGGSLDKNKFVHSNGYGNGVSNGVSIASSLGGVSPYRLLFDVAHGLSAVHNAKCVHCDIAPRNILLSGPLTCSKSIAKLADFGLSVALKRGAHVGLISESYDAHNTYHTNTNGNNNISAKHSSTLKWPIWILPPETMTPPHALSGASDVWALGLLMHEIWEGKAPTQEMIVLAREGKPFDAPQAMLRERSVVELYRWCLNPEPHLRPSVQEFIVTLQAVVG